jgi:Spy/CpxP family protein refolding chaperone
MNLTRFISYILILLLATSAFAQSTLLSQRPMTKQGPQRMTIEEKVQELYLRLNLSEEQRKKIIQILTKSRESVSKVIEDLSEKIAAIKKKSEADIEALLTREQRLKYKKTQEAQEEEEEETILKVFKGAE